MEVTVVSSQGKKEQLALDPAWSVTQLKKELHIRLPTLNIPAPEEQKLINADGRLLHGDDDIEPISTFCKTGDDLVVLSRRYVGNNGVKTSRETHPPVSLAQVNAAIKEENERLAAAGEPPPPPSAPSPRPQAGARAGGADRLEGSIRALVEGNFEQLRGYLEQLQEAVARQGIGGDEIMFGMPGDEDEEDDEDGEGMDEGDDDDEEGGGMAPHGMAALADALGMGVMGGGGGGEPVQIPQVEEAPLAELLAMGFPDQLSRNALLLHRNRLQPAVDWALSHVDDPQGNEPLTEDVLAAVYGPQRGGGGGGAGAFMARRRPRLPPGQVDPDTLNSMVEMGFDRDHSARALAVTGNRLEDACQLIINGMPLPPLPEQHPQQGQPAGGANAEGEGGNAGANPPDANPAAAAAGEAQRGQVAAGDEEEAGEMEHDGDDIHDEDWGSDDEDHDAEGEDIDIEHAVDVMFRGLGAGAGGGHPEEGVNWMSDYASDDDSEDYSDEEDDEDDDGEGFHDAGHAMVEEEEGAQPPAGAGEAPAAQEPPPGSQPQQPSSGTGGNDS